MLLVEGGLFFNLSFVLRYVDLFRIYLFIIFIKHRALRFRIRHNSHFCSVDSIFNFDLTSLWKTAHLFVK